MQEHHKEAFKAVVNARRSVRAFTDQPVPRAIQEEIFTLASTAPSNCNTQPWQVYVASGEACTGLRQKLYDAMMAGQFSMDFPYEGKYQGAYKERQYDAANQLYTAMGIQREEKDKRNAAFMRNFEFFGAPHVAFIFLPESFGIREAADSGMFAQNLMLALSAYGLASCPQTALSFHADTVREALGVDASNKLLFGISFGYEDTSNSANDCRVARAPLGETIHFCD